MPEWASTKTQLLVLLISNQYAITCMGISTIHLHSIKSSLPSLYPLHHSHDKLFPLPLFCIASEGKLASAWERGYVSPIGSQKYAPHLFVHYTYIKPKVERGCLHKYSISLKKQTTKELTLTKRRHLKITK